MQPAFHNALHALSITRTGVRTVLFCRPNGCNSSPRLALSSIASKRCRPDVLTVAAIFSYLCLQRKSFYLSNTDWRPDCIATSSEWMHLNAEFFLNSEERSDVLLRRLDGCKLEYDDLYIYI
jgi:hypothetical protein